jgi:hypothetical protein
MTSFVINFLGRSPVSGSRGVAGLKPWFWAQLITHVTCDAWSRNRYNDVVGRTMNYVTSLRLYLKVEDKRAANSTSLETSQNSSLPNYKPKTSKHV